MPVNESNPKLVALEDGERRLLASDPATPDETLRQLSARWEAFKVGAELALNPNTPWETLRTLLREFPQQVMNNPALPLLLLENARLFDDVDNVALERLLRYENCPSAALAAAIARSAPQLRQAARDHVRSAGEAVADWAAEAEPRLASWKLLNGGLPSTLPGEAIPAWIFELFAHCPSIFAREQVAYYPELPAAVLEHLGHDKALEVRAAVARHPHTPYALLELLADDSSPRVRRSLMRNPALTETLWRLLVQDSDTTVRCAALAHPFAPPDLLAAAAKAFDWHLRRAAAEHPHAPAAVLDRLARDPDGPVRESVAINPNTPLASLRLLAADLNKRVRYALQVNPAIPQDMRIQLVARDKAINVAYRRSLEARQTKPADVAPSENSPKTHAALETELIRLAHANSQLYRFVALASPFTPTQTLAKHAASLHHWELGYAIARNPNASDETLRQLAHTGNRYIRAAARDTLAHRHTAQEQP